MHPRLISKPAARTRRILCGLLLASTPAVAGLPPQPSAPLPPSEVVRIQLDALKHVDEPTHDAGFAIVFAFASPGNQAQTGPLKHFAQMIRSSYGDLLNHRSAVLEAVRVEGNQALQGVQIIDHDGQLHRYLFLLSRQGPGDCPGCWLTDSVVPDPHQKPRQEI